MRSPQINVPGFQTSNCDDEYMVIRAHVNSALREKIINFEYVDFAKLIPRQRVEKIEDHRLELIYRGGAMFFAPVSDRETTSISNFTRWEEAYHIYSNVLTRVYPAKASELIQYNHTIYTVALSSAWENVYQYDKEFRIHISKFPQCSWSIILQQAWSMCLKDRVKSCEEGRIEQYHSPEASDSHKEICKRFNKGKCTYGRGCKFDHRCAIKHCGKFGHGAHICRL